MTLSNVLDALIRKPGEYRSIPDIRRECFTPDMRADYLEHDKIACAAEDARKRFEMPSERLAVGLACFGAKTLADVPANERQRLELACVAHQTKELIAFDNEVVAAPLVALRPVRDRLLREFNKRLSGELDCEAELLSAGLRVIFGIYGCADAVETGGFNPPEYFKGRPVAPLQELRNAAKQARDYLEAGCPLYFTNQADCWSFLRRDLADVL